MARNRAQVTVNGESDKLAVPDKTPRDIGQLAEFIVAQTAKSRAEVFDALPEIVKALSDKAKSGDTRAATLVLAFVSETLNAPAARSTSKPNPALVEAMTWLPKPVNGKVLTSSDTLTLENTSDNTASAPQPSDGNKSTQIG